MARARKLKFDKVGYWSEIKLDIVKEYAKAYSTILTAQKRFSHIYIDAFAGAGVHISKKTGGFIPGSPLNALLIQPPFQEFHFIDLDGQKVNHLERLVEGRTGVHICLGDCNRILLNQIFPNVKYEAFRRGLCLLDPYGLDLDWEVIRTGGQMKSIDLFLNFPIMDMNRNVLWKNPQGIDTADVARMDAFWGDESWRSIAYKSEHDLFGLHEERADIDMIAEAFRERLRSVAGFGNVPAPLPMRNTKGAVVYYLFFASQKPVANEIVTQIFDKYRPRVS